MGNAKFDGHRWMVKWSDEPEKLWTKGSKLIVVLPPLHTDRSRSGTMSIPSTAQAT